MILPFQRLRYATPLRPDEVVSTLRGKVGDPPRWFKRPRQPYIGSVSNDRFKIRRNSGGRNSFLPILNGVVAGAPEGSEIKVRFQIHPAVLIFCVFWEGLVLGSPPIFRLGFSAVLFALFCIGYLPESKIAEDDLKDMIPPVTEFSFTQAPQIK